MVKHFSWSKASEDFFKKNGFHKKYLSIHGNNFIVNKSSACPFNWRLLEQFNDSEE